MTGSPWNSMLTFFIAFGIVQSVLIRSKKRTFSVAG